MAGEVTITITGNLTAAPELRFTNSGAAVAGFTVAVNRTTFNRQTDKWEDAGTSFYRCEAWRQLAENIAESLDKGSRVIVTGRWLEQHWETPEGEKRSGWKLTADAVGAELSWATATVRKMARNGAGQVPPDDAWANASRTRPAGTEASAPNGSVAAQGFEDEPPF
jgi:single-strand DNA-binding protein